VWNQAIAVGFTWVFVFVVTFVLLKVMTVVSNIRLSKDEERIGADVVQHGERAYN